MKSKSIYNRRLENHFFRLLAQSLERRKSILNASITISRLDLTPDLKNAKVYFTAQKFEINPQLIDDLNNQVPTIKKEIAHNWKYRFLPNIVFCADQGLIEADNVSVLLDKSIKDNSNLNE